MRDKKRYLLLANFPKDLPQGAKFLFQNQSGFIVRADLKTTTLLKNDAILVSGSIRKLKYPKLLNRGRTKARSG